MGTEGETGTGLGLSICKEIAHLHGGTLEVSDKSQARRYLRPAFRPLSNVRNDSEASTEGSRSVEADKGAALAGQLTNRAEAV
jgi:signal transduction histidine kinase